MGRKFSIYSIVFVVIGIFMSIMAFPPINIDFLGMWGILIGFIIYLTGLILGGIALFKKEKGFLKYTSIISLVFGIGFVAFIYNIFGMV